MKRIKECSNSIVRQEKNNIDHIENIKITGSIRGIDTIFEMIIDLDNEGKMDLISYSEILNNKNETRKRKFITLKIKR